MTKWLKYPENTPKTSGWYYVAYTYEVFGELNSNTGPKFWSAAEKGFFDSIDSFDKRKNVVAFIGKQIKMPHFDSHF